LVGNNLRQCEALGILKEKPFAPVCSVSRPSTGQSCANTSDAGKPILSLQLSLPSIPIFFAQTGTGTYVSFLFVVFWCFLFGGFFCCFFFLLVLVCLFFGCVVFFCFWCFLFVWLKTWHEGPDSRPIPTRTETLTATLFRPNPDLDSDHSSVAAARTFDNPDKSTASGHVRKSRSVATEEKTVLVITANAVLSQPYGDSVYVIEPAPEVVRYQKKGIPPPPPPPNTQVVRQQIVENRRGARRFINIKDCV